MVILRTILFLLPTLILPMREAGKRLGQRVVQYTKDYGKPKVKMPSPTSLEQQVMSESQSGKLAGYARVSPKSEVTYMPTPAKTQPKVRAKATTGKFAGIAEVTPKTGTVTFPRTKKFKRFEVKTEDKGSGHWQRIKGSKYAPYAAAFALGAPAGIYAWEKVKSAANKAKQEYEEARTKALSSLADKKKLAQKKDAQIEEAKTELAEKWQKFKSISRYADFLKLKKNVSKNNLNVTKKMMAELGPEVVKFIDPLGNTLFHSAESREMVDLLKDYGLDVNAKNFFGNTPLHKAVEEDNSDMVIYLVQAGADTKIKNNKGFIPLQLAKVEEVELD